MLMTRVFLSFNSPSCLYGAPLQLDGLDQRTGRERRQALRRRQRPRQGRGFADARHTPRHSTSALSKASQSLDRRCKWWPGNSSPTRPAAPLPLSLSLVRISIGAIATILDSLGFPTLQLFFSFSIGCDRKKSTILASVPLRTDSIAYVALIRSPRQSLNHNRLYPISNIVSIQSIAAFWPSLSRSLQRHHQSDWTRCFSFYSNQIEFL